MPGCLEELLLELLSPGGNKYVRASINSAAVLQPASILEPMKAILKKSCCLLPSLIFCLAAQAQWQTQSLLLKPGWTAVYLHVDPSYQSIDQLVGGDTSNPIWEIWIWQPPASTLQFVTSPQAPTMPSSQWANWARVGLGITSTLNTLVPNAAYLIHSIATTNYTWRIKGKPTAPRYSWTSTGLNFLDFPTPPSSPPPFDAFLALAPGLQSAAEIYQYPGGPLGPTNPARLFALHTTPVTRGQAFWIRSGTVYNTYFGPFQVALQTAGVDFGDTVNQYSFHLRNVTATNVSVTLKLLGSETPPAGQAAIAGAPPLLVRGALNPTNLTYTYSQLAPGGTLSWLLPPQGQSGSDIEVVIGVNRYSITGNPGALYAGILQFTDNFNFSEVDVPVSAVAGSSAGLWVGKASVTQVRNYLKIYQRDPNNVPVLASNGTYIVTGINTNFGGVPRPYTLRLIVHNDGTNAALLQRVYYGLQQNSNIVVATSQDYLDPAQLGTARRITATDLPWSAANDPWYFNGALAPGATLTTTASTAYDDQTSNPFLHTYHPDHDNLDTTFQNQLPIGYESYEIDRLITLAVSQPGNDFASLTSAGQTLQGNYLETITLIGIAGATRTFDVSGVFSLNRISTISTLTGGSGVSSSHLVRRPAGLTRAPGGS